MSKNGATWLAAGIVLVLASLWWLRASPGRVPGAPAEPSTPVAGVTVGVPLALPPDERAHREHEGAHALRGRVLDPAGAGVAGVDVVATRLTEDPLADEPQRSTRSGADGSFEFADVSAGEYELAAEAGAGVAHDPDAPWLEGTQATVRTDAPPVELVLQRGAVIRGRALGGSHQPLVDYVVVGVGRDGRCTWTVTTDAEGRFELVVPPDTLWEVHVSGPATSDKRDKLLHVEFRVHAGTRDLELQFVP